MSTRRIIPEVDDVDTLCCFLRLPQVISMCLAFSLVASMGNERGAVGNWCLAIWCLCFTVTVFISMYDCFYYDRILPFFWYKLPITYACYATLFCLLTSIMYPIFYVQYLPYGPSRDRAIAASAFSCIACVLYAIDVAYTWKHYKFKNIPCYVHTLPGLLKILESAVACHLRLHQQHLPVPAPAGPEVVRGRVLHLLRPGSRGHAAEAEWLGEQTAPPAPHFPSGADHALIPPLCQCHGPLATLPV